MGLRNSFFLAVILTFLQFANVAVATWHGSEDLVKGTWGSGDEQFGIEYGDTEDLFPGGFYILLNGSIIIEDIIKNTRMKIYDGSGTLIKVLKCARNDAGELNEECRIFGKYISTRSDGRIMTNESEYKKTKYSLYSPTGELHQTYTERPLELGVTKLSQRQTDGSRKIVIEYDDATYSINAPQSFEYFSRDNKGYLNAAIITGAPGPNYYRVLKYDRCGKEIASVDLPVDNIISEPVDPTRPSPVFEEVVEEYGKPVIGPNGDVYTWKRTPDTYSILKWTWVDEPTDTKSGDCGKK